LLPPGTQTSKALWISSAKYTGPVLVRGKDLTGSAPVLMYVGGSLRTEMQLPLGPAPNVSPTGWRSWPTQLAVTHSGCYRLQGELGRVSWCWLMPFAQVRGLVPDSWCRLEVPCATPIVRGL
jgi:hypothetical protein